MKLDARWHGLAKSLFRDLVRIDTTNPPGGELPACERLAAALAEGGIEPRIHRVGPSRANLTARLRGAETLYVQVDAPGADIVSALGALPGVSRVASSDQRTGSGGFEIESERGRDVRRELAHEIVTRGWGLLELRPMRMSLEEIFLQVTTEEPAEEAPHA